MTTMKPREIPLWDPYFLNMAAMVAERSKDPSTQVGCVITTEDHRLISMGYNGLPEKIADKLERYQRPEKYDWFEHAERNAIYNAARMGAATLGGTAYINAGCPCMECARGLIQSGIKLVIAPFQGTLDLHSRSTKWAASCNLSEQLFEEAEEQFSNGERTPALRYWWRDQLWKPMDAWATYLSERKQSTDDIPF